MTPQTEESAILLNNTLNFRKIVFEKIAHKNPQDICFKNSLSDVKKVVIINAAPRSGSSLLFAILRQISGFYSLSGESNPFYKLNGIVSDNSDSDQIPAGFKMSDTQISAMSRDFLSDCSIAACQNDIFADDQALDHYIDDLALRFSLQWPQVNFSYDVFRDLANQALVLQRQTQQKFCKVEFYLELLRLLNKEYEVINPYYYDIPSQLIAEKFPKINVPLAPPNAALMIEEPPFILLSPDRKVDRQDLTGKTLLLKSSADSYRMPFIQALLPNAEIKIIYLTRNPAASINGLYDGWLHRGFFSHNLKSFFKKNKNSSSPRNLEILGYSDIYEWGKWWWKYDLPYGWLRYARSRLEEVCAFQWYFANLAIQEYLARSKKQYYRLNYEDVISSPESRKEEISKIIDFISFDGDAIKKLELGSLSIVQATEAPQPYRWKKRRDLILPALNRPEIIQLASLMGYNKENIEEWI